jgi:hypothetical protein
MKNDLAVVFDFILQQWSFSPQRFKDAIINAALAKFVLSAAWGGTRFLVSKFPGNPLLSFLDNVFSTKPAKFIVLMLDVTLIDVFLFFAVVAGSDLARHFSIFSLWSTALFTALVIYMFMLTHADAKEY